MARSTRTYLPTKSGTGDPPNTPPEDGAEVIPISSAQLPKRLRKEAFGRRVYGLMMSKGWAQADLARASGIQRASISSYINGKSFPDPINLGRLARAFGLTSEALLPNVIKASLKASDNPRFQITQTEDDKVVWLDVHRLTSMSKALKVGALLDGPDDAPDGN